MCVPMLRLVFLADNSKDDVSFRLVLVFLLSTADAHNLASSSLIGLLYLDLGESPPASD